MNAYDDFVDLRSGNLSSESFWPSFTDIMMVVVIIFLLTSTILMVKNWELVSQLRESMIAEQQASAIIRDTSQENATLEEQLAHAQHEISMLRMQMMQQSEQHDLLAQILNDKERQLIIVMSENQLLQNTLTDTENKVSSMNQHITQLQEKYTHLEADSQKQEKELKTTRDQLIILTEQKQTQTRELETLQEDFGSLKVKYDKLIKPARTAKGKYVVGVNYQSINDNPVMLFKDAGDQHYRKVSEQELHQLLSRLKAQHKENLYIKLIIPENSGLSYNEAWEFMRELLEKYDYYYQ